MSIRLAMLLYKLGFATTYDADKKKVKIYRDK
jgi:hypothetical protein